MLRRRLMQSNSSDGRFMIGNYEVVDLGLSNRLLFATCNVGANEETDYGDYYMYGKGSRKYNSSDSAYRGTEDPLASSADTATQVMGSEWRMPTSAEFQELIDKTNYEWVTDFNGSGINGGKFTSKANPNAYVFFPAAGVYIGKNILNKNSVGDIWSSTPSTSDSFFSLSYNMQFGNDLSEVVDSTTKYGLSVRGVISGGTTHVVQDGDEGEDTVISTFLREYVERITDITTSSKTGYLNTRTSYNGFTSYKYKCPSGNYRPSWSVSFEKRIDLYDKYSSGKEVLTASLKVLDSTYYYECDLDVRQYTDGTVKISQGSIRLADNQTNTSGENIISLGLEGGNGSYTESDAHLNTIIYGVDVSYNNSSIGTADVKIYSDDSFEITLYS